MIDSIRRLGVAASVLLASGALTGCVTTKPMSETEFPHSDWDVVINATQQEIETETSSTDPMMAGGGLLGVLIVHAVDSSKNSSAEDAVTGLRDKLLTFDVSEEFSVRILESGVAERLSQVDPLVSREPRDFRADPLSRHAVTLDPTVKFSNDLSTLVVQLVASEYEADDRGRPKWTGFTQTYQYLHPLPEPEAGDKRDHYADAWMDHETEALEGLIARGMDATIAMLDYHVQERGFEVSDARYRIKDYWNRTRYREWRREDSLVWLAGSDDARTVMAVDEQSLEPAR